MNFISETLAQFNSGDFYFLTSIYFVDENCDFLPLCRFEVDAERFRSRNVGSVISLGCVIRVRLRLDELSCFLINERNVIDVQQSSCGNDFIRVFRPDKDCVGSDLLVDSMDGVGIFIVGS